MKIRTFLLFYFLILQITAISAAPKSQLEGTREILYDTNNTSEAQRTIRLLSESGKRSDIPLLLSVAMKELSSETSTLAIAVAREIDPDTTRNSILNAARVDPGKRKLFVYLIAQPFDSEDKGSQVFWENSLRSQSLLSFFFSLDPLYDELIIKGLAERISPVSLREKQTPEYIFYLIQTALYTNLEIPQRDLTSLKNTCIAPVLDSLDERRAEQLFNLALKLQADIDFYGLTQSHFAYLQYLSARELWERQPEATPDLKQSGVLQAAFVLQKPQLQNYCSGSWQVPLCTRYLAENDPALLYQKWQNTQDLSLLEGSLGLAVQREEFWREDFLHLFLTEPNENYRLILIQRAPDKLLEDKAVFFEMLEKLEINMLASSLLNVRMQNLKP